MTVPRNDYVWTPMWLLFLAASVMPVVVVWLVGWVAETPREVAAYVLACCVCTFPIVWGADKAYHRWSAWRARRLLLKSCERTTPSE